MFSYLRFFLYFKKKLQCINKWYKKPDIIDIIIIWCDNKIVISDYPIINLLLFSIPFHNNLFR